MYILKVLIIVLCITVQCVTAQNDTNFYQIRNSFYQGYNGELDTNEGSPLNQFRKTERIWGNKFSPTGSITHAGNAISNWIENFNMNYRSNTTLTADWHSLGPFKKPTGAYTSGTGRINCITFDPVDPNTIFVGSPYGGVWKSINDGQNWINLNTDFQLPIIKVSDIEINPNNNNMIFIATGDRDDQLYTSVSAGIYRSDDGGQNWFPYNTGLSFSGFFQISKILINHLNPDEAYISTSSGIYKTINATTLCQWTPLLDIKVYQHYFRNIIYKPDDLYTTLYASGKDILKSTNGGNTWTSMTGVGTGLDFSSFTNNPFPVKITLDASPASPDVLYASMILSDYAGQMDWNSLRIHYLFKYDGTSWEQKSSIPTSSVYPGDINDTWMPLAVSPVNSDYLFVGNVIAWRSLNGGTSPLTSTFNYWDGVVHPDVHDLKYSPDGQTLYVACDGGIYKLTNPEYTTTPNWIEINNGLAIGTIMKIGGSKTEPDLTLIGEFDCGSNLYDPATLPESNPWKLTYSGDGGEQAIDYSTSQIMYSTSQKNHLGRSINRGSSVPFTAESIPSGEDAEFIADYIMHPSNPNILYFDYTDLYKRTYTFNGTNWIGNWLKVSSFLSDYFPLSKADLLTSVAISETNPLCLYTSVLVFDLSWNQTYRLFKTTTGGYDNGCTSNCWNELFPPNPHYITSIAVSGYDQNKIWISYSGYDQSDKVKMFDGNSWSDYSDGLPNLPVNNLVFEKVSNNGLYAATDVGVYFRNSTMSQWEPFMDGLPNVQINELEINYNNNTIKAGTFGRGLWVSDLLCVHDNTPIEISNIQEWNTDNRISNDIIIKQNALLTIKSKISMVSGTKIIIEPGGKLILDGGILTNGCNNQMWQGIEVQGNSSESQYPSE